MYILGIHVGHDSSAALLAEGKVIGAVQEERFTRIKNYSGYPSSAVEYLLNEAEIGPEKIDVVMVPGVVLGKELPFDVLRWRLGGQGGWFQFHAKQVLAGLLRSDGLRRSLYAEEKTTRLLRDELTRKGFGRASIEFVDHHTCHAASAFFSSPFEKALVLTQDGKGDGFSGGVFIGSGQKLQEVVMQPDVDSIGQIYAEVTRYLGFRPNRHEGKVTGLAAFGDSEVCLKTFRNLVDRVDEIIHRSKELDSVNRWSKSRGFLSRLAVLANHPEILPFEINADKLQVWFDREFKGVSREDISAALQLAVEEWTVEWCKHNVDLSMEPGPVDICLAGGLFANVKINQRLRENVPQVENVYVQPAMGDSGLALGAAQLYWHNSGKAENQNEHLRHAYLGPDYSDQSLEQALSTFADEVIWERTNDIEDKIGRLLHDGMIIGRFNGRMEWGPRALGNRSILIRPTDKSINDTINKRLRRTEFMPFAPSVLDYRAKDYFVGYHEDHIAAEFMTITYEVFPEVVKQIEAVVHVDNTARPQVVRETVNPSYYKILEAYERYSGIGCFVNTSFNLHEEPIVNSPEDALRALLEGAVDVLAMGDYLVKVRDEG